MNEPKRIRAYLSGPIAGVTDARERFALAAEEMSAAGFDVVNPFDVPPASHPGQACPPGYDPGEGSGEHTSSACFMRSDILALLSCDQMVMLPDWWASRGVAVERAVAQACGMPICGYGQALAVARLIVGNGGAS